MPFLFADRENVEQGLCGMAVRARSGIDDPDVEFAGQKFGRTDGGMADHDDVDLERLDVAERIQKRFPFPEAAGLGVHVDDVSAQPLFREFEGDPCPRTRFDEKVDDRLAAQGRHFFQIPLGDFLELFGGIEDAEDLFP